MLTTASPEFVALCRAQIALLTQGLGAALSAVYLTEDLETGTAETNLIPIVAYPEAASNWQENRAAFLLPPRPNSLPQLSAADIGTLVTAAGNPDLRGEFRLQTQPLVVPLIHEDLVLGFLVTGREDRPWSELERFQIDRIAQTLALGCSLDQRAQWLEQERHQQQLLLTQQHDLLDNLLHQFRNPLTALRTFGKLLLRRLIPNDPNREVAASIVRESDRLQELLQQFDQVVALGESPPLSLAPGADAPLGSAVAQPLLPAASSLGLTDLSLAPCSLTEILQPLVLSAQAIAQERSLEVDADIPPNLPLIQGNPPALREVLSNLIDNALKYTLAGGLISIHVLQSEGDTATHPELGVVISDTGPGIPPQDLPHVFERHYRGVQANTAVPGTGLGLAIARHLVLQMQGRIQVLSPAHQWGPTEVRQQAGPGTTLIVWLAIAPTPR